MIRTTKTTKAAKKKALKPNKSKLIKEADRVFSLWIRQRDRNVCFTCGVRNDTMQAGHYFSRGNYKLRWDARNVYCQCIRCNIFLKGNYPIYAEKLRKRIGLTGMMELEKDAKELSKWSTADLEELILHYKKLLKTP